MKYLIPAVLIAMTASAAGQQAVGRHPPRETCTGWRDDSGKCRHGIGGSGMTGGRGGYLGPCGAGPCDSAPK
jgi:hypothetical protein